MNKKFCIFLPLIIIPFLVAVILYRVGGVESEFSANDKYIFEANAKSVIGVDKKIINLDEGIKKIVRVLPIKKEKGFNDVEVKIENGKYLLVYNYSKLGEAGKVLKSIHIFSFQNLKETGKVYFKKVKNQKQVFVELNGKKYGPFKGNPEGINPIECMRNKPFYISPDGSKFAFLYTNKEKFYIYTNLTNKTHGPFDFINYLELKNKYIIFRGSLNNKDFIGINDKITYKKSLEKTDYELSDYILTLEPIKIAVLYKKDDKYYLGIDGEKNLKGINSYGKIKKVLFVSSNGEKIGYISEGDDNKNYVVINNKIYGPYLRVERDSYWVSEDGERFAFLFFLNDPELYDVFYINLNGKELGPFNKAKYIFEPGMCSNPPSIEFSYDFSKFIFYSKYEDIFNINGRDLSNKKILKNVLALGFLVNNNFAIIKKSGENLIIEELIF